ncbi:hypothetical protein KAI56_04755 [Candidatus Parcubacteria bacterium]|nr:hypothetical protein [Candidatus Parcubacteria bacterium]
MKWRTKIEDRRLFFFACLGTGHFIMLFGAIENLIAIAGLGIMLGTLSSLALRAQEETVYNQHNYALWIKMKSNASVIRILNGILIIIIAMATIGLVATIPITIGIMSILIGIAKAATKEYFVKSSCRSVYVTTKYLRSVLSERILRILDITPERCLKIMEFKGCQRVVV